MEDMLAILLSDIHYRHRAPIARSAELHWYDAMDRQMKQVRELQKRYDCPVVVAGDVFDDAWRPTRCPPELTNFAIKTLPDRCYGVVGQHDLPNHRLEELHRSAFCTLMAAGKMQYLSPNIPVDLEVAGGRVLRLHGFPWGTEVRQRPKEATGAFAIDVAVIHAYVWRQGTGYPGADQSRMSKAWRKRLGGYDVAHFGDNHVPLHTCKDGLTIFNPGSFFRNRIDEKEHKPHVGLLKSDGTVEPHYLDCSQDKFLEPSDLKSVISDATDGNFEEVVQMLSNMADSAADFADAVRWAVDKINPSDRVKATVLASLEKTKEKR